MALLPRWIPLLLLSLQLTTGQSMSVQLWEFDTEELNLTMLKCDYHSDSIHVATSGRLISILQNDRAIWSLPTSRVPRCKVWQILAGRPPVAAMMRRRGDMTEIMSVFRSCTCKFL